MFIQKTLLLNLTLCVQIILSICFGEELIQSTESIKNAALTFVTQQLSRNSQTKVLVGEIDPRFRVTQCDIPLNVGFLSSTKLVGNSTLLIKCTQPKPWKLYLSIKIIKIERIVAAARTITRNQVIEPEMLTLVDYDVTHLPYGYYKKIDELLGKQSARSISIGTVLNPTNIRIPIMVSRGDKVTIIAESQGINIRSDGIALANGTINQKIPIKNSNSKKVIEAIITARGIVKVLFR